MKYKNIKAMAHNFVHSFLSCMNYVDDGYVIDDLLDFARSKNPTDKTIVQFIPHDPKMDSVFSARIKKALGYYREHFPKHCDSHKVDLDAVTLLQLQIVRDSTGALSGFVRTVDNQDKEYEQLVSF